MTRVAVLVLGILLTASGASAQSAYVQAFGGLLRVPDKTTPVVGGELGVTVAPNLVLFGNAGLGFNIVPEDDLEEFEDVCRFSGIDCEARVRALFATGGAKYLFDLGSNIRPYVAAGVGVIRTSTKIEADGDDITDDVEDSLGEDIDESNGLLEVGGGVQIDFAPNVFLDAGYRLMKVFEDDADLAHRFTVGLGWKF
jgi:opacity protein-like surface antigen